MTGLTGYFLFMLTVIGGATVLAAVLVGLIYVAELVQRWRWRWSVRRSILAADWRALRAWARMAERHWWQTTALLDKSQA